VISSFFNDDVPTIAELRFAELYGESGGWGRGEEGDPLGEIAGTLAPRVCRGPNGSGEPFRGGVVGRDNDRSLLDTFAVYADSIGDIRPPTETVCLWLPPDLLSKVLNLDEIDEVEVTVVERDEGNE
jgi:hypothetical protein